MKSPSTLLILFTVAALVRCDSLRAAEPKPIEIEFKALDFKVPRGEEFELEKHMPQEARDLHGQRVRIRGFMHPSVFMQHGIKTFVLVADNQEMTFGLPRMPEAILVDMAEDATASFDTKRMAVTGTLAVEAIAPEGKVLAVYRLRDAKVERPAPPVISPAR